MAIIFANSYEDPGADRGPSEGEMFFTNLLGGLKTGVENWNQREYARMDRDRQLKEQLAAEERQFGRQKDLAEFGSQLTERRDQRQEQQRIAQELRREERAQNSPAALAALELAKLKVDREKDEAEFQKLMRLKNEGLLDKENELALKETKERLAQMDAQSASLEALGDINFDKGVQSRRVSNVSIPLVGSVPITAPGTEDIDSYVDRVSAQISAKATSIKDLRARERFREYARSRLQGEIDFQTKTAKAKKDEEERVRADKQRRQTQTQQQVFIQKYAGKPLGDDDIENMQTDAALTGLKSGDLTIGQYLDVMDKISAAKSQRERNRIQRDALLLREILGAANAGERSPKSILENPALDAFTGGAESSAMPSGNSRVTTSDDIGRFLEQMGIPANPQ
jgi:hypothetical protein